MHWVRRLVGAVLVAAIIVVGLWFPAANESPVRVEYFWGAIERPLWQWLVGCFAVGFLIAALFWLWSSLRSRLVERRYRKTIGRLEAEIHQLRNLPLSPESGPSGDAGAEPAALESGAPGGRGV